MIHVLVRYSVADYGRWKESFDSELHRRKAAGELHSKVFQSVSNPREVTVLTQWDTLDHAKDYFGSEELPARMQRFGVVGSPEVHFLEDARLVRRTAAD